MNLYLEHVVCDFCGCKDYKVRYRKPDNWLWPNQYEFPVVECKECGLVYLNPRPTQESMANYYPKDYHENRNTPELVARYKAQTEYLPDLSNKIVLDIGCARGDYLNYIHGVYPTAKLFGVDFFSHKVDFDFITFYNQTLPEAKLEQSYFDIVTSWAVFEHLHHPAEYFKEVHRVLKPGGKFFFLVTNSESLYGKRAYVEDIPRHTYHFSEKSLRNYASKYNFNFKNCFYETRFWNPTGYGTFYYLFGEWAGLTWEKRYFKESNRFQRFMSSLGRKIDSRVFRNQWEAKRRRSGIIIIEFEKL